MKIQLRIITCRKTEICKFLIHYFYFIFQDDKEPKDEDNSNDDSEQMDDGEEEEEEEMDDGEEGWLTDSSSADCEESGGEGTGQKELEKGAEEGAAETANSRGKSSDGTNTAKTKPMRKSQKKLAVSNMGHLEGGDCTLRRGGIFGEWITGGVEG